MNAISDNAALWWITIGIALVVTLCVVVLLSLLTAFVRDIDRNVGTVAATLGHVASNTGTVPHLQETVRLVDALGTEVGAHISALSRTGVR